MIGGDMVEIGPFEVGRRRDVQKQTGDINAPVARRGGDATEPGRDC